MSSLTTHEKVDQIGGGGGAASGGDDGDGGGCASTKNSPNTGIQLAVHIFAL